MGLGKPPLPPPPGARARFQITRTTRALQDLARPGGDRRRRPGRCNRVVRVRVPVGPWWPVGLGWVRMRLLIALISRGTSPLLDHQRLNDRIHSQEGKEAATP